MSRAIVNYYSIREGYGIRCVLKEKSNNAKMENAEKIDREILFETKGFPNRWWIDMVTREMYDIKDKDYLRLLIGEIIHS